MGENRIVCQVKIHFKAFLNINTVLLSALISESGLFSGRSN